jgi:hypothetical protein
VHRPNEHLSLLMRIPQLLLVLALRDQVGAPLPRGETSLQLPPTGGEQHLQYPSSDQPLLLPQSPFELVLQQLQNSAQSESERHCNHDSLSHATIIPT